MAAFVEKVFYLKGSQGEKNQGYGAFVPSGGRKWVMAIHGSGRDALAYRDVPFYTKQRDIALNQGCNFVALSLGQDVWARPQGLILLDEVYHFMVQKGFQKGCVLMASSAGGCQMFRFAQVFPERVRALVGFFPVWDVEKINLPSLQGAWKMEGEGLKKVLKEHNPARWPEKLPTVPVAICHGLCDQAVPIGDHALHLARHIPIQLHMTGEGHSTQAFGLYETPIIADILQNYCNQEE